MEAPRVAIFFSLKLICGNSVDKSFVYDVCTYVCTFHSLTDISNVYVQLHGLIAGHIIIFNHLNKLITNSRRQQQKRMRQCFCTLCILLLHKLDHRENERQYNDGRVWESGRD